MFLTNQYSVSITTDDIQKKYSDFKGKRIKVYAVVNMVSLNNFFIKVKSSYGDIKFKIPKKLLHQLKDVKECLHYIDTKIVVEGEPYFCAFERRVNLKQVKVLEIIGY